MRKTVTAMIKMATAKMATTKTNNKQQLMATARFLPTCSLVLLCIKTQWRRRKSGRK